MIGRIGILMILTAVAKEADTFIKKNGKIGRLSEPTSIYFTTSTHHVIMQ